MERYLPTGNEQISIPRLNEVTAAIEDITFLYMACRGLLDLRGGKAQPLMQPFVEADGTPLPLQDLCWRREAYWVPAFTAAAGPFGVEGVVLAPVGERGFAWKLRVTNRDACPHDLQFGLQGCWHSVWHCVNEDKEVAGTRACYRSAWNNSLGLPLPLCPATRTACPPLLIRPRVSPTVWPRAGRWSPAKRGRPSSIGGSVTRRGRPPLPPRRCCARAGRPNGSAPAAGWPRAAPGLPIRN